VAGLDEEVENNEPVLFELEATYKQGSFLDWGSGRLLVTKNNMVWLRRRTPVIRRLLFWIPDQFTVPRSSIRDLRLVRDFTRSWLQFKYDGHSYAVRPGIGPYPTLRNNPETTEKLFEELSA
jgi:hypothetical protein